MAELEAWIWCLFHSAYLPAAAAGGEGGQAAAALPNLLPKPPKRWAKRHLFGARFSLSRSTTSPA